MGPGKFHQRLVCFVTVGWMIVLVMLGGGCASGAFIANSTEEFPRNTGFSERQLVVDGQPRTVWIFVPRNYRPDYQFPAILFLHGLFEAGNGGNTALQAGLGPIIAEDPDNWPFITIFPQSPGNWKGDDRERLALAALDYAQSQWTIDPDRVVLAGLSYGALGVWEIGAKHPDRFAALVPVSGHRATEMVERLVYLPIWAFSAKDDAFVPATGSEEMCRAINQKGGWARLTEFTGGEHDCWDLAVHESNLVNWMLHQHRRAPFAVNPVPQPTPPVMASMTGG
jgi:predicted peptidase